MPIRPEERHRYPPDWDTISANRKAAVGWRCEDCQVPHGELGCRAPDGQWCPALPLYDGGFPQEGTEAWCRDERAAGGVRMGRILRIVLTTGHLDHTPENCAPHNLRVWCQRCHLRYDAQHHRRTRAARERAAMATAEMFGEG